MMKKSRVYIVLAFAAIACMMLSCKSVSVAEKVNYKDSTIFHHTYDTTHVTITDTTYVEKHVQVSDSSSLVISFGEGGGTYNAKTGEATNVAGVQQTDTHHEQRDSTAYYRNRYEAAKKTCYELQVEASDYKHELEHERTTPKRSGYDRFCSWWFWITAILLLIKVAAWVMEKFPATAPYIIIARRFIPFL